MSFLASLLAAQILLLAVMAATSGGTESRPIESLVLGIDAPHIERMTIATAPDDAVTFARKDGGWVLPDADDFPVNNDRVDEILDKLLTLDTRRLVASQPCQFCAARGQGRRLPTTHRAAGRRCQRSHLPGRQRRSQYSLCPARRRKPCLSGRRLEFLGAVDADRHWIDASYVNIALDDVQQIQVRNTQGDFNLLRADDRLDLHRLGRRANRWKTVRYRASCATLLQYAWSSRWELRRGTTMAWQNRSSWWKCNIGSWSNRRQIEEADATEEVVDDEANVRGRRAGKPAKRH